jgi:hypothetical protein
MSELDTPDALLAYDAGTRANIAGYGYDATQTKAWRTGWQDAEEWCIYANAIYLREQAEI